jgi:predicted GTPase
MLYRDDPDTEVIAFTATQIPGIEGRLFPPALAGPRYPAGIPIHAEQDIEALIRERRVDQVAFAYSDISVTELLALSARVQLAGADFVLPGARGMLRSRRPVLSIGAVRTGVGKSQTARFLVSHLQSRGIRTVAIRHPMPYGDLGLQAVQRFATPSDLVLHACTIEEREEYEPYLERGLVVYAGVDYRAILQAAEQEADLILWDGGNNDLPFVRPDFHIVLLDPHRPGDALRYYPSAAQVGLADLLLLAKADTASTEGLDAERALARRLRPEVPVVEIGSRITVEGIAEDALRGRRVVCVEDGPTTTHGGMKYGAATILARRAGAEIVDPRPHFVGELGETLRRYPALGPVVPAMGYSPRQQEDLGATLLRVPADLVLSGTPIDLADLLRIERPIHRVRYELEERPGQPSLAGLVDAWWDGLPGVR